jgi:hypothetical protein
MILALMIWPGLLLAELRLEYSCKGSTVPGGTVFCGKALAGSKSKLRTRDFVEIFIGSPPSYFS